MAKVGRRCVAAILCVGVLSVAAPAPAAQRQGFVAGTGTDAPSGITLVLVATASEAGTGGIALVGDPNEVARIDLTCVWFDEVLEGGPAVFASGIDEAGQEWFVSVVVDGMPTGIPDVRPPDHWAVTTNPSNGPCGSVSWPQSHGVTEFTFFTW